MVHSSATQLCFRLLFVFVSLCQPTFFLWCICVGSGRKHTHDVVPQCSVTQCAQYMGVKGLQLGNSSLPMQLDDSSLLAVSPDLIATHFGNIKVILLMQQNALLFGLAHLLLNIPDPIPITVPSPNLASAKTAIVSPLPLPTLGLHLTGGMVA